jgi:hypothetical protein
MKKIILILASFVFVGGVSFYLGGKCYEFNYNDVCLDMGGGKFPGEYPICVLEKKVSDDVVYFCDEFGNKFVSEEEARRYGLSDPEFGATYCPEEPRASE